MGTRQVVGQAMNRGVRQQGCDSINNQALLTEVDDMFGAVTYTVSDIAGGYTW